VEHANLDEDRAARTAAIRNAEQPREWQQLGRKLPKSLRNNGCGDLYYIFTRIRDTLRVSPATEAGIADELWSMDDLVRRIGERFLPPAGPRGPYNKKTGSGIAATGGDDT
jgi:hypothetical protein